MDILSRATFEDTTLQLNCTIKPGNTGKATSNLLPGQVFCLQEVSWRYSVNSSTDNYGWPKSPISITVSGIAAGRVESPLKLSPPKLLVDVVLIEAVNPSEISVTVHFTVKGTLVTPQNGEPLSLKEIFGYVLLDDNHKGMMALSGISSKQLGDGEFSDTLITSLFHNQLPGSKVNSLTSPFSQLHGPPKLLTDESSLISLMIGDLATYQEATLNLEQIRNLAKYLIDKKWSR